MKINEIIKQYRLEKNLTQEQVAERLGITTPAVNKWEKGSSYPDITLLPALARLLGTDLNTLLSFQEDLTPKEVSLFLNDLSEIIEQKGFDTAYEIALEKVKQYPSCDLLLLNVAMFLDGGLMLKKDVKQKKQEVQDVVEDLYQRAACSQDMSIKTQAQSMLISKLMQRKEYDKAEKLLQTLPPKILVDTEQIKANLLIQQGQLEQAAKLEEEKLLSATNEIQTILMTLMEIAIKEKRMEDAEYIANVSKDVAKLFDLWEYHSYVAHFQLYSAIKNPIKCLKILLPMLKSLTKKWNINQSPLYRHIKTKNVDGQMGKIMQKTILEEICSDESTSFLQEREEFEQIVQEINPEK